MLPFSEYSNTRRKFLQEQLQQAEHNKLCFSRNLLMTEPKRGFEDAWQDSREQVNLIKQMLLELPNSYGYSEYVGTILNGYEGFKGVVLVDFEIATPERSLTSSSLVSLFSITKALYAEWVDRFEMEREQRVQRDLPLLLYAKVKKTTIYELSWVDVWE